MIDRRSWNDHQLTEAVSQSSNILEVIGRLNLSTKSAGNYTTVRKHINRLNLDTSHFKKGGFQNGHLFTPKLPLEDILIQNGTYSTSHLRERLLKEGIKEHRCENCNLIEWKGVPIPLELEHINGISNDHRLSNIKLLCPNCHALTDTWRGRNRANRCLDCKKRVSSKSSRCVKCSNVHKGANTKIDWPEASSLLEMVKDSNYSKVARELGVTDNAIRARLKKFDLLQ